MNTYSNNDWRYYYGGELYHYGILGQKWGIRRYQNEDGSLTEAGKKRYAKGNSRGDALLKNGKLTTQGKLYKEQIKKDAEAIYEKYHYQDVMKEFNESYLACYFKPLGLSKSQSALVEEYADYCEDRDKFVVDRCREEAFDEASKYERASRYDKIAITGMARDRHKITEMAIDEAETKYINAGVSASKNIDWDGMSFRNRMTEPFSDRYTRVTPEQKKAYDDYCKQIEPTVNQVRRLKSKIDDLDLRLTEYAEWESDGKLTTSERSDAERLRSQRDGLERELYGL